MAQGTLLRTIRRRARIGRLRRGAIWIGLLCAFYLYVGGPYGFIHYRQLCNRHEARQQQRRLLVGELAALQRQIERLQNDTLYIEKVARERYGFARKGERIYKIVPY